MLIIKSLELLLLLIILIVIVEPSELLLLCSEIILVLILIIIKATEIITWLLLLSTKLTIILLLVILLLSILLLLGSILLVLVLLVLLLLAIAHLLLTHSLILLSSSKPCLEVILLEPLSKWITTTLVLLWCRCSKLAEHAWVWYETLGLLWFCSSLLLLCLWSIEVEWVGTIWSLLLTSGCSEGAIVFGAVVIEEI